MVEFQSPVESMLLVGEDAIACWLTLNAVFRLKLGTLQTPVRKFVVCMSLAFISVH